MVHRWRKVIAACLLVSGLILAVCTAPANLYINSLVREWNKRYADWECRALPAVYGEHFTVYHRGESEDARLVLDAAETFYPLVARDMGLDVSGVTPVMVYQDMSVLNRSFGWSGNVGTMGVYWAGEIRVLAPSAWIGGDVDADQKDDVFFHSGPMAHEITHLFVDHLTRGSCPRWFNEGVAQYEEYRLSGFRFADAELFDPAQAFSYEEMAEFDALEDQGRAYHQSFSMVCFLVEQEGWDAVRGIMAAMGRGETFGEALRSNSGYDETSLMRSWQGWLSTGAGIAV